MGFLFVWLSDTNVRLIRMRSLGLGRTRPPPLKMLMCGMSLELVALIYPVDVVIMSKVRQTASLSTRNVGIESEHKLRQLLHRRTRIMFRTPSPDRLQFMAFCRSSTDDAFRNGE